MSLKRERLTALLREQALTSVELVIAPPGYGKTMILREYAAGDPGAVYIALPEAADLEAFVRAVVAVAVPAALRSIGAVFNGRSGPELERYAGEWLVSRLRGFNGTLIVDDFHRTAGDERVARVLVAAIAATNGRMRWLVAAREAPRFPMGSWIARGWMGLPVSGDDLRFTRDEGAALAESLGIDVAPDALDEIVRDTVGWPIGVRLALSLVARKRAASQTRMQTREALFALIDDEIWQPLGAELQQLIAAAALIPAPAISTLVAAGFAGARIAMTSVFERIPFVQTTDGDAFSIHDLFREFVAARSAQAAPADAQRVGMALVATANPADGLRLLVAGGSIESVHSALAVHAFDLLETGHRALVGAALGLLSERGFQDDGVVVAMRGAIAYADGGGSNSANLFARALERGVPAGMRAEVSRRLALSYANRGMTAEALAVLAPLGSDEALSAADRLEVQAMSAATVAAAGGREGVDIRELIGRLETSVAHVDPAAQARTLQRLANAAFYAADLETAERLALDSARLADDLGMDTSSALAYGTLYAVAGLVDADMTRARTFLHSQAAAAERAANSSLRVYALRAEYTLAANDGEFAAAAAIEKLLSDLSDARLYRDSFAYRRARSLRHVVNGEFDTAESAMRSLPTAALSPAERAHRDGFLTVVQLLRGKRAAAQAALERGLVVDASQDFWSRIETARAYAFRGIAFWALDRPAQARKAFELEIADLPLRDRIFIDALRRLAELPHPLPNQDAAEPLYRTLREAGFSSYAAMVRALVERDANDVELSTAEIETLREFDRFGGRAADVAKALGKSKYTVQNQIQSAIRKLGCSGRAEALAYARRRGWLDRA